MIRLVVPQVDAQVTWGHTCMMTCTSFELPGSTTPELGRTQYFFGEVVLTLKAIFSAPVLVRDSVTGIVFRSSKRNFSSLGEICRSAILLCAGRWPDRLCCRSTAQGNDLAVTRVSKEPCAAFSQLFLVNRTKFTPSLPTAAWHGSAPLEGPLIQYHLHALVFWRGAHCRMMPLARLWKHVERKAAVEGDVASRLCLVLHSHFSRQIRV